MLLQIPGLVSFSPAGAPVVGDHALADWREHAPEQAKGFNLEDTHLLHAARAGDKNSFRLLVDKYHAQVAGTVIGMLGSSPEANDIGQETFVRFYQSMNKFRGDSALGTYLTRIAMNLCLNEIRRRKRHSFMRVQAWEPDNQSVDGRDIEAARDFGEKTRVAVARLDPGFRAVVVLCWMEERTAREAADILGIPLGTVLSRLHRARQNLRTWLDPEEES
jgi:RNA polymerase sigma-70 factor (ECF subfamily)